MAGAFVTAELDGLEPVLAQLNALGSPRRVAEGLAHIGSVVESQTTRRIQDEKTSPAGEPWAAWSPGYAEGRTGKFLLQASNALVNTIAWDLTGDELRIGSNLVYAALHQFGGTDDMAPGAADVPARPFLGVSPANAAAIEDAMGEWIGGLLQ